MNRYDFMNTKPECFKTYEITIEVTFYGDSERQFMKTPVDSISYQYITDNDIWIYFKETQDGNFTVYFDDVIEQSKGRWFEEMIPHMVACHKKSKSVIAKAIERSKKRGW